MDPPGWGPLAGSAIRFLGTARALTDDELVVAGDLQAVSSSAEEMTARAAGVRRIGCLSSDWEPED